MGQLAFEEVDDPGEMSTADDRRDYVPLMLARMGESGTSLRALALQCGIGKTRLGLLLHGDPMRRSAMTLLEFQHILHALGIEPIEAFIQVEMLRHLDESDMKRFRPLTHMLCAMFRDLPVNLISALEDVEEVDGTEVRPEWAPVLQRAVIKRLVHEIDAVARRRRALGEFPIT